MPSKKFQICFVVAILTRALAIAAPPQSSSEEFILRAAGSDSATAALAETQREPRQDPTSKSRLPPLRVRIISPAGQVLPEMVRAETVEGASSEKTVNTFARRTLSATDRETVRRVLNADTVLWAEVERPNVEPTVEVPFNQDAARSHFVPQFIAQFSPGDGAGLMAAVFDGGAVRTTHQEFVSDGVSRVTLRTTKPTSFHATHVAGTIAATGIPPQEQARGMAAKVSLLSYDWDNDLNELATAASEIHVSNHSYGPLAGWYRNPSGQWFWWGDRALSSAEDAKFGKYAADNSHLDFILHSNPNLITVVAAGNDRDDQPPLQPISHRVISIDPATGELVWAISTETHHPDGFHDGGLDTIAGLGLSKNAICVGAVHDVLSSSDAITTTTFSSWGPSDDHRIKPDVIANGFQLLSTDDADDSAYVELSGTSMASPTAAGIACLLCQQFEKTHHSRPTGAELKAVLIHTATDAGVSGPDPIYGWGSINALRAGRVIASQSGRVVRNLSVRPDSPQELAFTADGKPVRITVVWTDPAAPPNAGGLDDAVPTLQHNLDAVLTAPNGAVYHPYSLVPSNPLAPATTAGPNVVDNVEVIDAPPMTGTWKLKVAAGALSAGADQPFALVVSGLVP